MTCVPIKELKDTATFSRLVESSADPVIVTRNGYDAFAVMTVEQLEALKFEADGPLYFRETFGFRLIASTLVKSSIREVSEGSNITHFPSRYVRASS